MKVSELGEFGLIELLAEITGGSQVNRIASWQQLVIGIGDDAAVWHTPTSTQLTTVDSFIEGVHFPSGIDTWWELGWKALAVNLSDIAAMGGLPRYALVSLAVPGVTEVDDITALFQGMNELAQQFGVAIIGGDTSHAPLVIINITVLGSARHPDKPVLTRATAMPGDKIAVTGYLGTAAAGLEMLTKNLPVDVETTASLKQAFLKPYPRLKEGQLLVELGVKTAIDISDGLISDLQHICKASQVSARIEVDRVPIPSAVRTNFENRSLELALSGGEDYELLFMADNDIMEKVKTVASCPITVIGEIETGKADEIILVDGKWNPVSLPKSGWEHFTAR